AYDDVIEEHLELLFLSVDFSSEIGKAQTAQRMIRGAGRNGVGLTAALPHCFKGLPPALADAYAKLRRAELDVRAEDAAQLNVSDPVVHCVGPVHPMLLHQIGFEAQV